MERIPAKPFIKMRNGWYIATAYSSEVKYAWSPKPIRGEKISGRGRSMRAAFNAYVRMWHWVRKGRPGRKYNRG